MSSNSEWTQILTAAVEKSIAETFSTTATTDSTITADEMIAKMNDAMKKIGPPPVDPSSVVLDQIRARRVDQIRSRREYIEAVEKENAAIQRKWDKEFNGRVLDIVRKALHRGLVQVAILPEFKYDARTMSQTTMDAPKIIEVRYDKYRKDAYWHLREQAEKAVRASMRPPNLHKVP